VADWALAGGLQTEEGGPKKGGELTVAYGLLKDGLKFDANKESAPRMMVEGIGEIGRAEEMGRYAAKNREMLEPMMQEDPENPELYGAAALLLLRYPVKDDRLKDAERFASKAVKLDRDHPDYHYALGMALFRQKRLTEALEPSSRAVKL